MLCSGRQDLITQLLLSPLQFALSIPGSCLVLAHTVLFPSSEP